MGKKKLYGFELLAEQAAEEIRASVLSQADGTMFGATPIERLLFHALYTIVQVRPHLFTRVDISGSEWIETQKAEIDAQEDRTEIIVEEQAQLEGWRVDFLIHVPDWRHGTSNWKKVIVECDGHDFHERTKEQAAKDRSRDRAAQKAGIKVLRFTGSEIWRDPMRCAAEIIEVVEGDL